MAKTKKLKRAIKRAQKFHAKYKSQRHRIGSIMKPAHSVWLKNKGISGLTSMRNDPVVGLTSMRNDPYASAANSLLALHKTPMAEANSLLALHKTPMAEANSLLALRKSNLDNYGSLSSDSSDDETYITAINNSFRK